MFKLKTPCNECPFLRKGGVKFLGCERATEIIDGIQRLGESFSCHKTLDYDIEDIEDEINTGPRQIPGKTNQCAGAMILMQKIGTPTTIMQIGQRMGHFKPEELDMDAPVFVSTQEFIEDQAIGC